MGYKGWTTDWEADREAMVPSRLAEVLTCGERIRIRQHLASQHAEGGMLEILLDEALDYLLVSVTVDFRWDSRPCAWYVPFEFAIDDPAFDYENCGKIVRLGRDQVPNANMDYQTVQDWVRVSGKSGSVTIIPQDTPIASMGGFFFGRLTNASHPRRPLVAAWLHSNYWDTNYAASCLGPFTARFAVRADGSVSVGASTAFAAEINHPLILQPVFH
jgi:hypothetical protein